tara:strand:+ start:438 stop:1037 length:600 start_codon:yes stop_codon:yes gene_type:complete
MTIVLNFIKLGINLLLKNYFQKIKIIDIQLTSKNNKFKSKFEKIIIEAEQIIYKGIYLNYAKIKGYNLNIDFKKDRKFLKINNFYAETTLHISSVNLRNIIKKNHSPLNKKVREFVLKENSLDEICFDKELILFKISRDKMRYKHSYKLKFENNNLILIDINTEKYLLIPFEKSIIFNCLNVNKDYLKIKLKSKVKFDN